MSFAAPPGYELWWRMTEACAARQGKLEAVSWYVMPRGVAATTPTGEAVDGYWQDPGNRIVLASWAQFDGPVVRHEMLHALLGAVPGHPQDYFRLRCGGIVACGDECFEGVTTDSANPNSYTVLPPDSLEVSATITPATPSSSLYDGQFALIVSVTNKRTIPVFVSSPVGLEWRYRIQGPSFLIQRLGGTGDPQPATFQAGQTKQVAFDLVLRDFAWPPGILEVLPSFGGYEPKTPLQFTVAP
jgi:hypothetical protein